MGDVGRRAEVAVSELASGDIGESAFQARLRALLDESGGNYDTVGGAVSGALGPYDPAFERRVVELTVEIDTRMGQQLPAVEPEDGDPE
jgi:hypothetical protein